MLLVLSVILVMGRVVSLLSCRWSPGGIFMLHRESMVGDRVPVIMQGFLGKKSSGVMGGFVGRYFRLVGHYLQYYEREPTEAVAETLEMKGVLDLHLLVMVVTTGTQNNKIVLQFKLDKMKVS